MTTMQEKTIFELRQYTLYGGKRNQLIDLFEREFIESQEELGLHVVGTFLDLDDPDRFVWVRSFTDMETRGTRLSAFYDGPVWKKHRDEANATMLDSDNVLLLRPTDFHAFDPGSQPATPSAVYGYHDSLAA